MKYYFKSPLGTFFISSAPYGGYNLLVNDTVINWADSASELALQVYDKTSGFEEWDNSIIKEKPENLEAWQVKI